MKSTGFFGAGSLANRFGRRPTMRLTIALALMCISEAAPAHLRGRLASQQQMAVVPGLFGVFLSNTILAQLAGGAWRVFCPGFPAWRWMFWMAAVTSAVFLAGALLIPETPRLSLRSF